ncbi:methyl-accepting chemotaxis protein [Aquabacterium sp.]|uniref:methyl-accepting chemotaxis protein n=1 Tax=Aquabacterium sp. TaxID=1872578 RepID=UPI0035B34113
MGNLSIGKRLALGFGLLLLLAALMLGTAVWRLQHVDNATHAMMNEPLAKERLAGDVYRNVFAAVRRTSAIVKSTDASLTDFFADDTKMTTKASTEAQAALEKLLRTDEERAAFAKMGEVRARYIQARDSAVKAKASGDTLEATRIFESAYQPTAREYLDVVLAFQTLERQQIDVMAKELSASNDAGRLMLILLGVLAIALGAGAAWFITRSITQPLAHALEAARQVAQGNLKRLEHDGAKDEMGQLINALAEMQDALSRVIGGIRDATESITTASTEIAVGNQDLSSRTEHTASSLEETASSMEQLTGTVNQTADSARTANQLASSASTSAAKGGEVVSQVVRTMEEINTSSRKISDIIGVIDGIAFQTNILALNAAVEAARAGEQGRGFAVVASEVRNLAQRSANAAKEIKTLIVASTERVESGSRLVSDAGETMQEIMASVQRVADIIGEISCAATEQSDGIRQVNVAVNQLDQMTQQNAALVEQSAAAAESLKEQARKLTDVVGVFRLA